MENLTTSNTAFSGRNGALDGAVNQAAGNMHETLDKVAASAEDAAGHVQPAIARVARVAHQTVDRVAGVAGPTASWLTQQGEKLQTTQRNAVADARVYIAANPWQSVGVVLAAGFLIGRLSR